MRISFHGAAQTVTGSKHLIELSNGTQILLDCGMFQGMGENTDGLNGYFGFRPDKVDYLILSHAHIDHCGLIPRMVAEGFNGIIFSTAPTMDLAHILLNDSARIQEQDAEYSNKHRRGDGLELLEPLYTENDVMEALRMFKIVDYDEDFEIDSRISLRFTDAGHILGSAAVHLKILDEGKYHRISFSGDVGRYGDPLLKDPQNFPQADYLLLESTYGDSLHKDLDALEGQIRDIIHQTCKLKGGKVIIPAFSVGRTQELLYALNGLHLKGSLPDVPYYVDSPLSEKATNVLKEHPDVFNKSVKETMKQDDDVFHFEGLKFIQSVEESKKLNNDPRPCVIISSSGMAEAGRVKHHIKNNIGNEKNTILIVGYCEPSSLGGKLVAGSKVVRIFADDFDVRAEVREIKSMSAHGDYEDLLRFLSCQDPNDLKTIFLVHGEYNVQTNFRQKLIAAGFSNVIIPKQHDSEQL
ncbi:MBL fold metallo-hydrolase [Pedobacter sp. P351]|uniref:MBL fold metallo-hydrolase n=1 Tax=Pedobacter superstes TaxID=3133441 RepID=UPI0030AAA04B